MMCWMKGGAAAVAVLLAAGCANLAPRDGLAGSTAHVVAEPGFSAQRLSDHIKVLAADEFAGRFPGEVGETLTLDYLQAQYEAMGLLPGGPDGQWRQPVDLVRFTPLRAPTAAWSAAGERHALTAGSDINLRARSDDGQVNLAGAPLVFAGYGVVAPERGWDDYGAVDLSGKVVLILAGQPAAFGADPNFYGSTEHKLAEAYRRGALGVVTLNEAGPSDPAWQRAVRGGGRPRMTTAGQAGVRFTGSINRSVAEAMTAATGQDLSAWLAAAKAGGAFKAAETGLSLDVDIAETTQTVRSHNLLAKIPGTRRPDEYLIYSAHWDHVGKADQPDASGDDIYNGAWDNASGTAGVMEMARAFKAGPPPERTVVFLHVTAEEQGLLGSEWYGDHPVYPLARTAADINIDMLPFTPASRNIAIFGLGKTTLEDDLAALATAQGGRVLSGDGQPEEGFYYRSDHFNFAVHGVPALMPWTGTDLVDGGEAVGRPYYQRQMAAYYHKLDDEWRADYDFSAALQNLQLLYQLGQRVANSRAWPQWKPGAEFVGVRAETAAARR